ncbi:hypothetical protein KAI92_00210 [Candidatus Parcubacteria bacterium]|nr:hypothetical protein [Candidatus Parcubacteria bacterium]
MKLKINRKKINGSAEHFLRRNGYQYLYDKKTQKESYIRTLTNSRYPRLHLYLNVNENDIIFDLHLDQKKTSYKGANMHSAEYDGEVVGDEIMRLQGLIGEGKIINNRQFNKSNKKKISEKNINSEKKVNGLINVGNSAESKLGQGNLTDNFIEKKEKSWWKFW